jgi:hypothetical protein
MAEFQCGQTVWYYKHGWLDPVEYVYVQSGYNAFRSARHVVYRRGGSKIEHLIYEDETIHGSRCEALEAKAKWLRSHIKSLDVLQAKAIVALLATNREIAGGIMKTYNIWVEGYVVNGDRGYGHLSGTIEAESFAEACAELYKGDMLFNKERLSHWGCRLFDNEADAKKGFG